jgi:hypothetical protein
MDFLTNLILYGLAFVGVLVLVASLIAAAMLSFQERFGYLMSDAAFDEASSATDRLHAEAQRAIRELEDLANRGDR